MARRSAKENNKSRDLAPQGARSRGNSRLGASAEARGHLVQGCEDKASRLSLLLPDGDNCVLSRKKQCHLCEVDKLLRLSNLSRTPVCNLLVGQLANTVQISAYRNDAAPLPAMPGSPTPSARRATSHLTHGQGDVKRSTGSIRRFDFRAP